MNLNSDIVDKIEKIKWFSNCGRELTREVNFDVLYVNSWEDARHYYQNYNWESTTLEARNILTSFLQKRYAKHYSDWNVNVRKGKEILNSDLTLRLNEFSKQNSLDQLFVDCVLWDILNAFMEERYCNCKEIPTFFLELFKVYEQGNFPCGWQGEWPEGRLIIL